MALVSKIAYHLLQGSKTCEKILGIYKTASHTSTSSREDITALTRILTENRVAEYRGKRKFGSKGFVDPRRRGIVKLENGWLRKFLDKTDFVCDTEGDDISLPRKHMVDDIEDVLTF